MKKSTQALCALGLSAALPASLAWYCNTYTHWQPKVFPFTQLAAALGIVTLTLFVLWMRGERKAKALIFKTAISLAVFVAVLNGVSAVINNGMYGGSKPGPQYAVAVALPLVGIQIVVLLILLLRAIRRPVLGAFMAVIILVISFLGFGGPAYMDNYKAPPPPDLREGKFASFPPWGDMADFTVSPGGMGLEAARDAIREKRAGGDTRHFSVEILPGEYNIKQVAFDQRDFDTTYSTRTGEDEAVFNGGMRLETSAFAPWEKNARIQVINLKDLGLAAGDWGKMYSFGGFTTASMYDDGQGPLPCELFFNGTRCTIARYPNGDAWLKTGKVTDNGETRETYPQGGGTVRNLDFDKLRNPRGGTFAMDKATAARAAAWASIDDVWMFGCFRHDWADMSTPVKAMDLKAGTVTAEYVSAYGYKEGASYYFYNVLEELDEPGEWYLDRVNGLLYLWPPEDGFADARIDISLSAETLIQGEGLKNVTFRGLTLQGTRGDGMNLKGDSLTVEHCAVRNVAGSAITVSGCDNIVSDNEIYRVGKQGITISGGDQATLTPGNSRAVNNLVHDFAEVVMTYQGGVNVYGTGNLAAHNEICNSPHTAMFFGGNNHVIEYNLIHDVCLITDDAGAIYSGRSLFDCQGTAIRSNVLYNLGSGNHTPCGIYLDDGLSGVTVENNLLLNVPDSAIAISGRDLEIRGNVVVNAGKPVAYDQRTREGALSTDPNFWFHAHTGQGGDMWKALDASPWQTELWKQAFPKLAALSTNFDDIEDPGFAANPAGSSVTGNVFVGSNEPRYAESVQRFNTIADNEQYSFLRLGSYWTLPGYENIPVSEVGRTLN